MIIDTWKRKGAISSATLHESISLFSFQTMSSTYADALWPLIPENISTTAAPVISNAKAIACDVSSFWSNVKYLLSFTQPALTTFHSLCSLLQKLYHHLFGPSNPKAYYNHLLQVATNYEQWAEAASLLDDLEGRSQHMTWREDAC